MQHLKPWRALLLLTVLCQPGTSDKYGNDDEDGGDDDDTIIHICTLRFAVGYFIPHHSAVVFLQRLHLEMSVFVSY